ncbi:hypothetical protein AVEN_116820-1 [Araneus ventricosus]|uniref:Uncharacterized protein n=1 Tax=Araneus ventricosus TaxID=182803 RepID=A0A4Y2NUY9_ARAVE|nr:hypothetical protein AVEN_116820-1 [Araneus ventricosus]
MAGYGRLRSQSVKDESYTVVAACSDQGYKDQSVVLIKLAGNGSSICKYIENPSVLVINSSHVVITFDEMMPKNMRTMTMKKVEEKIWQLFVLQEDHSNTKHYERFMR